MSGEKKVTGFRHLAWFVVMGFVLAHTCVAAGANWAHTWGGPSNDYAGAVARDSSGNVYVAGGTASFGAGGTDALILKYSSGGALLWAKTWGGSGIEDARSIAFGPDGFLYVVGGTTSFGAGWYDMFLLKLDTDGNLQWGTTWGGASFDLAYDLGFDSQGNIYVVGESYSFGACVVLLKFSPNGGSPLWTRSWKGPADYDSGYSVAVDSSGNVIIAGISWDYSVSPNHNSILLVKYDASGNYLWSENWVTATPGEDESWSFRGLTTDSQGNIYVGGRHAAQCQSSNFAQCNFDAMVLKLDPAGRFQWANTWGGPGYDTAASVAINSTGQLLLSGTEDVYGQSPMPFVLTYNSDGNLLSSTGWEAPAPLSLGGGPAMILDNAGNAYLAGAALNNSGAWASISGSTGVLPDSLVSNGYSLGSPVGQQSNLTNPTQLQTGGVIDTGGGGADAFVAKIAFGFLRFPLRNKTASTAAINSVFDHSMTASYCADKAVTAYTGEEGFGLFGSDFVASYTCSTTGKKNPLYGFRNGSGKAFVVNGHYSGGGNARFLYYQAHPGYDYKTVDQNQDGTLCSSYPKPCNRSGKTPVLAAADGTVVCVIGTNRKHCPGGGPEFDPVVILHDNGYSTIYLHMDRQDIKVKVGDRVAAGQVIGLSGTAGVPRDPHLHFEVHNPMGIPVDPYGWAPNPALPNYGQATDPYMRGEPTVVNINLWE
jgi:hypothetical protein